MDTSAEHRWKFGPSSVMVTSPSKWKILEWNKKTKQTNKKNLEWDLKQQTDKQKNFSNYTYPSQMK